MFTGKNVIYILSMHLYQQTAFVTFILNIHNIYCIKLKFLYTYKSLPTMHYLIPCRGDFIGTLQNSLNVKTQ